MKPCSVQYMITSIFFVQKQEKRKRKEKEKGRACMILLNVGGKGASGKQDEKFKIVSEKLGFMRVSFMMLGYNVKV